MFGLESIFSSEDESDEGHAAVEGARVPREYIQSLWAGFEETG